MGAQWRALPSCICIPDDERHGGMGVFLLPAIGDNLGYRADKIAAGGGMPPEPSDLAIFVPVRRISQ